MPKELDSTAKVSHMTPQEVTHKLGHEEPLSRLAFTVINKETGAAEIIINSTLPQTIQQVLLEHERVQYEMIQGYSGRGNIEDMMPYAHYAALDAGIELAIKLGVIDEYLHLRGQGETVESIRNAVRP